MLVNRVTWSTFHRVNPNRWLTLGLNSSSRVASSSLSFQRLYSSTSGTQCPPSVEVDSDPKLNVKTYPFSGAVIVSAQPIEYDNRLGLIGNVEKKLISGCANQEFQNLFRKNHPESIRPLSIVKVESYTNAARTTTNIFTGVLMAVRRRGTETSFRLRTMLEKVGVEMKFNLFSPIIKNITVIQRAGQVAPGSTHGKPMIRKPRRAKLFYLRDHPEKMPDIRKISKAVLAVKHREEQT